MEMKTPERCNSELLYTRGRAASTASLQMEEMGIDPMGEIRELGYEFSGRRLCKLGSNEGYEHDPTQYDRLAEAVVDYVGVRLEDEADLRPLWLPLGSEAGEGCPIYVSDGFECARKLCVIIPGAGRVGAGVWAASLCINKSLDEGTALPFIHKARCSGYGVIVLNPNCNSCDGVPVQGSETSEKHVQYVLEKVVLAQCTQASLDLVAHSVGGRSLVTFLCKASAKCLTIDHIVFTDSYHAKGQVSFLGREAREFFSDSSKVVNFVPHASPLGTPVDTWFSQDYTMTQEEKGCTCLSAGVEDHAATNFAVMDQAFEFFRQTMSDRLSPPPDELPTTPTRKPSVPEEDNDSPTMASKPRVSAHKRRLKVEAHIGRKRTSTDGSNTCIVSEGTAPAEMHSRLVAAMISSVTTCCDYFHDSVLARRHSNESAPADPAMPQKSSDSFGIAETADQGDHGLPERVRSAIMLAPKDQTCGGWRGRLVGVGGGAMQRQVVAL